MANQTTETKKPRTEKITADKKTIERCDLAREAAGNMGRTFVPSIFKTLAKQDNVKISVPTKDAKYLKFIEGHKILAFEGSALQKVVLIDVHSHYAHFDVPVRNEDKSVKPAVTRHFYIHPDFRGETIVANVEIKEKHNLLTGKKTLVIDIVQVLTGPDPVTVEHDFRLNAPVKGEEGEIMIPGTDRCVQIAKTNPTNITCNVTGVLEAEEKAGQPDLIDKIAFLVNATQNN